MLQNACAEISRPLQGISPIRIRSRSAPSVLNISKIILAQFPVRVQCFPLKTPIVHEHVTIHSVTINACTETAKQRFRTRLSK